MIDLSKHIQEGARLELEALELSTDECSFLSAQNSAQAMQIDALKADLAAAQEALKNHLHLDNHNAIVRQLQERAQRAEALAEQTKKLTLAAVEQRLHGWRQRTMNRSGDRLALDDFMGKDSIDDLIDFVCDEYAAIAGEKP